MKIVLIRHGITVTNKKRIFSFDDSPLAEEAYPMLNGLKPKLKDFSSFKVYSSPFKRALQTAEYLGLKNIQTDKRLQEYNFGILKKLKQNILLKQKTGSRTMTAQPRLKAKPPLNILRELPTF